MTAALSARNQESSRAIYQGIAVVDSLAVKSAKLTASPQDGRASGLVEDRLVKALLGFDHYLGMEIPFMKPRELEGIT